MERTMIPGYTIGADAYNDIPHVCASYGTRALMIGGKQALAAARDKIFSATESSPVEIIQCLWHGGEASLENIEMLMPEAATADMIFAVGGGKAIDTGKVLAQRMGKPFFTFPTIASTCAAYTSLGILYHPDGSLREYSFSKIPPNHVFINTQVIAEAPVKYLWAGIGDTMAKHYECTISSRGHIPCHIDGMGIALSTMCAEPLKIFGEKALADCGKNLVTPELTETVLGIIISTGMVSNFVQVDYTTGLAHAVYNGFTVLPSTEEFHHLHGEVVSYGILVLLTIDKQYDELNAVFQFSKAIGLPTKLADLHATVNDLQQVADKALAGIDVRVYPYEVTDTLIIEGILELEEYNRKYEKSR